MKRGVNIEEGRRAGFFRLVRALERCGAAGGASIGSWRSDWPEGVASGSWWNQHVLCNFASLCGEGGWAHSDLVLAHFAISERAVRHKVDHACSPDGELLKSVASRFFPSFFGS